jgi:glutamate carboxypeptidase
MATTPPNPFDQPKILDGIRRWVEIETPTERPRRSTSSRPHAQGYATCPRRRTHRRARRLRRSSRRALGMGSGRAGILVLSHHRHRASHGFIERLPFKIDGDSAFGPGIYDMKGGAYLAYHAFRQICARRARRRSASPAVRLRRGDRQPDLARADRGGRDARRNMCW